MARPEITKRLHNIALIADEDKKECEKHFQIVTELANILSDFKSKSVKCKNLIEKLNEKLYNVDEGGFDDVYRELAKKCEELQETRKALIKKQKSMEKLQLKSSNELSKQSEQLTNLKTVLNFYKILPAEFDFTATKTTGFISHINKEKCHGFELNPQDKEANIKYLWKRIEKVYTDI